MPYDVKLPDIGEGIAEGEIVRWLVKPGEAVREDQPLVEVMTDKASVEIPSPRTGVVASLRAEEGQVVPVGTVIISIAVDGETARPGAAPAASAAFAAAAPASVATPQRPAPAAAARAQAAPAVRALAREAGVDLERVAGTGPGGAVTADDVKRAAAGGARSTAATSAPAAAPASSADEERIPLRGLRRRIAEHMQHAVHTAAHFTFVAECDFTPIVAHRASVKARATAAGIKLTYLAYVLRALPEALRRFPSLNASLDDARGEIVLKRRLHLGVATETPEGLTVPIVHDADRLGLFALAREIERLATAARAHALKLDEVQGGTFTITSTGARGGVLATPIIHHPQVAILGVHEIRPRPAVVDGQIVIRDLGNLSLSLDHRVVDGAVGAEFLYLLIDRLQQPDAWIQEGDLS